MKQFADLEKRDGILYDLNKTKNCPKWKKKHSIELFQTIFTDLIKKIYIYTYTHIRENHNIHFV